MRGFGPWWALAFSLQLPLANAAAQAPPAPLRVFLDCQNTSCDFDYLRREIAWVDWVRDRTDAQVHILITERDTGGGGEEYTLRLIGLGRFQGHDHELTASLPENATEDEERRVKARAIRLGLASYAASIGLAPRLDVTYEGPPPGAEPAPGQPQRDRWNFWVFRIGANGFLDGESRANSASLSGSARATRVTEAWKMQFVLRGSRHSSESVFDDGTRFESTSTSSGADAVLVRSLGQHWSVGAGVELDQSDFENLDGAIRIAPGLEYNVWPYAQSSRRQLTVLYEIGLIALNYRDTTIFDRLSETRPENRLTVEMRHREPWGSAEVSLRGEALLDDWAKNRLSVAGELEFRVFKGLSVDLFGQYSRIRNQINLSKEGASDEDVLLRLRELETGFRYFISAGLSYTFGSIFNNIVNPRFEGSVFF